MYTNFYSAFASILPRVRFSKEERLRGAVSFNTGPTPAPANLSNPDIPASPFNISLPYENFLPVNSSNDSILLSDPILVSSTSTPSPILSTISPTSSTAAEILETTLTTAKPTTTLPNDFNLTATINRAIDRVVAVVTGHQDEEGSPTPSTPVVVVSHPTPTSDDSVSFF